MFSTSKITIHRKNFWKNNVYLLLIFLRIDRETCWVQNLRTACRSVYGSRADQKTRSRLKISPGGEGGLGRVPIVQARAGHASDGQGRLSQKILAVGKTTINHPIFLMVYNHPEKWWFGGWLFIVLSFNHISNVNLVNLCFVYSLVCSRSATSVLMNPFVSSVILQQCLEVWKRW